MHPISPLKNEFPNCPNAARCQTECIKSKTRDSRKLGSDTTDPSTIYAAAFVFLDRFGTDARNQATLRADELRKISDYQGRVRWQLITKAIDIINKHPDCERIKPS